MVKKIFFRETALVCIVVFRETKRPSPWPLAWQVTLPSKFSVL